MTRMRASAAARASAIMPVLSVDASSTMRISYSVIRPSPRSSSPVSCAAATVRRIISSSFHIGNMKVRLLMVSSIISSRKVVTATEKRRKGNQQQRTGTQHERSQPGNRAGALHEDDAGQCEHREGPDEVSACTLAARIADEWNADHHGRVHPIRRAEALEDERDGGEEHRPQHCLQNEPDRISGVTAEHLGQEVVLDEC